MISAAIGAAVGAYAKYSSSSTSESPNHNAQPFSSSSSGPFPVNRQGQKKQNRNIRRGNRPEKNRIKCNVDGSIQNGSAGCGGIFRDASGAWLHGFAFKLGQCDIMESELWAIITGLSIAWEKGFRRVSVETDNSSSVDMIKKGCPPKHRYYHLIDKVKDLMDRWWKDLDIVYVDRKENKQADWMADYSHQLKEGLHEFVNPPEGIKNLLKNRIRCNVDGSVQNGSAGCGGVFRDASGAWLYGFSYKLSPCDNIMEAELWGIITGLSIAWKKGFRSVILETGNSALVDMIKRGCEENHRYHHLIERIKDLEGRPWNDLDIVHVNRKGNKVAAWMADYSHKLEKGLQEFIIPPDGIKILFEDDSGGISPT